ncbi:hypothetical protein [Gandjariella thermophila]|uniref:DUF308 domain-containing protein n=1 Tax=Gandjariella thermophila TaxID=1931992 RepID=A0A4D4J1L0_9PSEU|nr:hypothetical protein [Gandjariella thermophila]GDY30371.1 hypothetical protein GTS_20040 [Gandjariella thermophila]
MSSRGSEGPEDVDAAFAEIVAGLERDFGGRWPEPAELDEERPSRPAARDAGEPTGMPVPEPPADDDDHYVPPEPPPFPRLRAGAVVALVLFAIGALLLVAPGAVGIAPRVATPLALISLSCGIGWLVLRMRTGPPPDSGPDDGAQL